MFNNVCNTSHQRSLRGLLVSSLAFLVGCSAGPSNEPGSEGPSVPPSSQLRLVLTASPQNNHVFLSWGTNTTDHSFQLQWSRDGSDVWQEQAVAGVNSAAVPVSNGVPYRFKLTKLDQRGNLVGSAEATMAAANRDNCTHLSYMPWYPTVSVFCSWHDLNRWLEQNNIAPSQLRCRNRLIESWNQSSPDCYYTVGNQQLLLLRSAASTLFETNSPTPSTTREIGRFAIWGEQDPFKTNQRIGLTPLSQFNSGMVRQAASATGYLVNANVAQGTYSRVVAFQPRAPRIGRFAIYHEGHGGAATQIGAETIDWLLTHGWTVFAVDMPLIGQNESDVSPGLRFHNDFVQFDNSTTSPLAAFLLPVKAVVDHIYSQEVLANASPTVLMIGRSGGGWTTYTYSALDERVSLAVSIAGGRPLSQRLDAPWGALELGDYEQTDPTLYSAVGHEQLMVAAGSKGGLLIFNEMDPCCFRVARGDPFIDYVRNASLRNGTAHRVFIDIQNTEHSIGPGGYQALSSFLSELAP